MPPDLLKRTRRAERFGHGAGAAPYPCLDIAIDEAAGSVQVYDPRVFHAGRRGFCRRLLEAASQQPGIHKVEIDLASASCRVQFDKGSATSFRMADVFSTAVRQAAVDPAGAQGPRWWRPTPRWSALTAYRGAGGVSFWETLEARPDRSRLRARGLSGDRAPLARLADTLAGLEGVDACRVSSWFHTLTIEFHPESPLANRLLDRMERALEAWKAAEAVRLERATRAAATVDNDPLAVATGLYRLKYLAMAGGAFAATLVALVVPGIPTVPCLLATSYYLSRSSPWLDGLLRRTAFLGPILDEWEQHHALSRSSKGQLIGLTAAIIVVTVVFTPRTPVALVLILLVSLLSLYGIVRSPALSEEPPAGNPLERPALLALPTP